MARRRPRTAKDGPRAFEVLAPARADLAGGTLDLWPLHCFHRPSVTVNVALATGVRLCLLPGRAPRGCIRHVGVDGATVDLTAADAGRHLAAAVGFHLVPEGGFEVEVLEQPPIGSGLGGSSVLAVALARGCLTLGGKRMSAARLVAALRDLEAAVLEAPTGIQDYLPALFGGCLAIHFRPGGERVERLAVPAGWLSARLLVVYSGITHSSGLVNWDVYRARVDGDAAVAERLERIAAASRECREALLAADEAGVGRAIAAEWAARAKLAAAVNPLALQRLIEAGAAAGALAAKACGAGGGGSVLFWVPPGRRLAVRDAVLAAAPPGARELRAEFASRGVRVHRVV